ncbi:MAG: hypothetical protein WBK77_00840 [Alphaproteobacteria bacterium]
MTGRERDLADVRDDIVLAGAWITAGIFTGAVLALAFVYFAVPYYRISMIVAPASPMVGDVSAVLPPFSMVPRGLSGGGPENAPDFVRFEAMMAGPTVAERLLQDDKILRGLSLDKNFQFFERNEDWTPEEMAEYIGKRARLEPVGATMLRRVIYYHPSPEFGVYFVHRLHRVTDDVIRERVRAEAGGRVYYLQEEGVKAANPEHRRALTGLLLDEERRLMLSSIDHAYAAAVVEAPSASPKPRWPDAMLVLPVLMFSGAVAGFLLHGLFGAGRDRRLYITDARGGAWYPRSGINNNELSSQEKVRETGESE